MLPHQPHEPRIITKYSVHEFSVVDNAAANPFHKDALEPVIPGKRRKTIMRSFRLGEISAVDKPAVAGATAAIMKRDEEPEVKPVKADNVSVKDSPTFASFEAAVADGLAKRNPGQSRQSIIDKCAKDYPDLFAKAKADDEDKPDKDKDKKDDGDGKDKKDGADDGDGTDDEEDLTFEQLVDRALAARRNGESRQSVLEATRKRHPGAFAKSQKRPLQAPPNFAKSEAGEQSVQRFLAKVDDFRRTGLSRNVALEMARRMHPKMFEAYQNAK